MLVLARIFQKHIKPLAIYWSTTFLIGCAAQAPKPVSPPQEVPLPKTNVNSTAPFNQETLYSLIAAEIGLVRGRYELGLNNYVQQARDTQDLNVTIRATQVARILKRHPESLEMAEQWRDLDPGSEEARVILVAEYNTAGQYLDAFMEAKRLLLAGQDPSFDDIAISASRDKNANNEQLVDEFEKALQIYARNTELLIGSSILLHQQEQYDLALARAKDAEALEPNNVRAIYQRFRTLNSMGRTKEATTAYGLLVEIQPENRNVRKSYARMLVEHDLSAALEQYTLLYQQDNSDSESKVALAITQHELGKLDDAQRHFLALIEQGKHLSIANYSLGEIAYEQGDSESALSYYSSVKEGRQFVQAIARAANIITDLSGFEKARAFLSEKRLTASEEDQQSLYSVEADALAKYIDPLSAIQLLNEAITTYPDSIKLRYSRAMKFASLRRPLLAEKDFLHILNITPDDANALNSLGYTLLDQTKRTEEAGEYIKRALALDGENAAILDSMGWYLFKIGESQKALDFLERAYAIYQDDEVAAHLGEVLWAAGKRSKAKKTWREGLELEPNSPFITETIKRLNVPWGN